MPSGISPSTENPMRSFAARRPLFSSIRIAAAAAAFVLLGIAVSGLSTPALAAQRTWSDRDDAGPWIGAFSSSAEPALREADVPIWDRDQGVVLGGAFSAQLDRLSSKGIAPFLTLPDHGEWLQILSHDESFAA